jgi:hypothetical protein
MIGCNLIPHEITEYPTEIWANSFLKMKRDES